MVKPKTNSKNVSRFPVRSRLRFLNRRLPASIKADLTVSHKFRFQATSAVPGGTVITWQLLTGLYGMAVSNSSLVSSVDAVQLASITVYGPAPASGATSTVALEWIAPASFGSGGIGTDTTTKSDTSNNAAVAPFIHMVPPANSYTAMWHDTADTGNAIMFISAPVNTIVDVAVTYHFVEDGTVTSAFAYTSLIQGITYYGRLDGPGGVLKALGPSSTAQA